MTIGPSLVLAVLVGVLCSGLYVLIRGHGGGQVPLVVPAAVLGAWAGDAIGVRLGLDLVRIGDFRLLPAIVVAALAIGFVAIVAILGPHRDRA